MAEPTKSVSCFQAQTLRINGISEQRIEEMSFSEEDYNALGQEGLNKAFQQRWVGMIPVMAMRDRSRIELDYKAAPLFCDKNPQKALEALQKAQLPASAKQFLQNIEELKTSILGGKSN